MLVGAFSRSAVGFRVMLLRAVSGGGRGMSGSGMNVLGSTMMDALFCK
jgi:hypothetical protein